MMSRAWHRLVTLALGAALGTVLAACGSGGAEIGRTIADLAEDPPIFETAQLEPQANFEFDRSQVIESLRDLVELTEASGGGTGDELRRLADLELETSLDKRLSDDEATQLQGEQEALHAIAVYETYLQKYPGSADNDKVLYQLSRAYALETDNEDSMDAMNRIVNEYPASKYMDEVQFRRGEYLFVEQEHEAAELAYNDVVSNYPDSIYFEKSLYKYGWTLFKQGRFEESVATFISLLDINLARGDIREIDFDPDLPRADQELLLDVTRVVSLAFTYEDDNLYISRYFAEHGKRDYEPMIYLRLGELYLDQDRIFDGAKLFLGYTSEYPYSPHTPYFHQRAIETYQVAGYGDLVLEEKIAFVNRYEVNGEYWNLQAEETQAVLSTTLVLHLTELATHYHSIASESRKPADYQVAADWYRRFLKSFPKDPAAPRMNFLLAEILFETRQYAEAIDAYEKTAYGYDPHKDAAEAGYAALVTYDSLYKQSNAEQQKALQQKRIESAVFFTTTFSDDPRVAAVEMQSAQQFFTWKQYPAAIESAQRLIDNPKVNQENRREAWGILADSQFSTHDYTAAETSYQSLLGFISKQDKQYKAVREQVAASIYKQGELARDAGDHRLAAKHFTRLGQTVPESPTRVVAEYDAATAYMQLEDWPAAIDQLNAFRKNYPGNKKFGAGVTEKLALAYSNSGNTSLAAAEILALSRLPGSAERKRDLMWRSAELYQQDGQPERAIEIYKEYVELYPFPLERSIELRHQIAESYRTKADTRNLYLWLNEIVKADARGGSERSARSKYLAATASLELSAPLQRSYRQVKLTVPLKTSLGKKKKLMQQSIDAYTRAIKYQVAEVTTEATYQIAEIYHDFARSLMSSERPNGLDEDQLEEYELLLEEQAFPFEEKAIDIHLANFKRIPAGTYDEPTRKSLKVLGELMPFRYARAESSDSHVEIQ